MLRWLRVIEHGGAWDAYSRRNIGKPGPSVYADKALALMPAWQKVIDGS